MADMTRKEAIEDLTYLYEMDDYGSTHKDAIKLAIKEIKNVEIALNSIELLIEATGHSDDYEMGFCNGLIWLRACFTGEEPKFFEKESEDRA